MTSNLTITLRGQSYTAPDPTRHEAQILASLFLPGESEEERIHTLQTAIDGSDLFDLDLDDPRQQTRLSAIVTVRIQSPINKARIASTLRALFPDLPEKLVDYHLLEYRGKPEHVTVWKLEDAELMEIINAVLAHLMGGEAKADKPQGFTPRSRKRKTSNAS